MATATLVWAANLPDVDVASFVGGEYASLALRRGITHGVPALLVLPFLLTGLVLAWDRWVRLRRHPDAEPVRPKAILFWAAVGVATHPLLDWMNVYGMRWWLPFDGTWTYLDALFIIDPWLWLALGGAVFLAAAPTGWGRWAWGALAALTTALILSRPLDAGTGPIVAWLLGMALVVGLRLAGRPAGPRGRRRLAAGALAGAALYVALMVAQDGPARGIVADAARTAGLTVEDVMVGPLPADPLSAEVEVRTPDAFVHGRFHWLARPRVVLDLQGAVPRRSVPPGMAPEEADRVVAAARDEPEVADYLVWSRYPYVRITPESDGWRVRFSDARYDNRPEAGGLAGVEVVIER